MILTGIIFRLPLHWKSQPATRKCRVSLSRCDPLHVFWVVHFTPLSLVIRAPRMMGTKGSTPVLLQVAYSVCHSASGSVPSYRAVVDWDDCLEVGMALSQCHSKGGLFYWETPPGPRNPGFLLALQKVLNFRDGGFLSELCQARSLQGRPHRCSKSVS